MNFQANQYKSNLVYIFVEKREVGEGKLNNSSPPKREGSLERGFHVNLSMYGHHCVEF